MNPINKQAAKVALVTGGARRIGAAIVKKLHSAGYKVAIHCRYAFAEAQELADQLNEQRPDSALVLQKELTEAHAAHDLMTAISTWAGQLHLLVNNASVFIRSDCHQAEEQNWDLLFNANVKAPFLLSLAARPLLAKHSGVIINITDIHAKKPLSGYSVYCQTKAALEMQTKSLARELAPEIRVNAVAPGSVAWPENENSLNQEIQQKIIAETPLKRHGNPEFIAQAVLALAENPFITGQIVQVDGGRSLN
ncbi:MAG: pteridine reductase [Legionella sp.]|uniref:pteridine reductase n=1 Tax=Legionella sp. TaxID=459 RepID=UPI0028474BD9|nr:pteridine reductase [Legionella sp.]